MLTHRSTPEHLDAFQYRRNRMAILMVLPFLVLFIVFRIFPVFVNILLSFTYFNGLEWPRFIGLTNYFRLFMQDDVFMISLRNTLIFGIVTGPVSYLACFILAWFINELKPRIRAVLTVLFYAPSISGGVFMIWTIIFGNDMYGIVNGFLIRLGLIVEPIQWLTDVRTMLFVVMLVQLWLSLSIGFLAFIAGLQGLDRNLFEAGAIDGIRNRFQELWFITLPQMQPILIIGAVLQITASFGVSTVSAQLVGNPSTDYAAHTIMLHMADHGGVRFEIGYASTIATILAAIMLSVNKIIHIALRKVGQ